MLIHSMMYPTLNLVTVRNQKARWQLDAFPQAVKALNCTEYSKSAPMNLLSLYTPNSQQCTYPTSLIKHRHSCVVRYWWMSRPWNNSKFTRLVFLTSALRVEDEGDDQSAIISRAFGTTKDILTHKVQGLPQK